MLVKDDCRLSTLASLLGNVSFSFCLPESQLHNTEYPRCNFQSQNPPTILAGLMHAFLDAVLGGWQVHRLSHIIPLVATDAQEKLLIWVETNLYKLQGSRKLFVEHMMSF